MLRRVCLLPVFCSTAIAATIVVTVLCAPTASGQPIDSVDAGDTERFQQKIDAIVQGMQLAVDRCNIDEYSRWRSEYDDWKRFSQLGPAPEYPVPCSRRLRTTNIRTANPIKRYSVGTLVKPKPEERQEIGSSNVPRIFDGSKFGTTGRIDHIWNAEALIYGGSVGASSFGASYNTSLFGGRADFGFTLPYNLRAQFDIEGEGTNSYCTPCGSRSEVTYGAHLDYKLTPRFEIGGFGGFQKAKPTFGAPTDTNYFLGGEARYDRSWWMVGLQTGYFDVSSGPGTLTNAWFAEGRAKISLGHVFGVSPYFNPTLGVSLGRVSGSLSTTSIGASTTQWSVTLSQRLNGTPITGFVGYHDYTNRVDGLGTVWNERILKGGIKIDFSSGEPELPKLETSEPFPQVLRLITNF
jgi:hypothetical protein